MSRHNYSKYSNKNNDELQPAVVEPEVVAETPVIETTETPEVKMEVETVETLTVPETVKGVVANCTKLNVRVKPAINTTAICVLDAGSEVEINIAKSTDEWFSVRTANGANGFCMRKFVNANL